jgi:hypothetical protein
VIRAASVASTCRSWTSATIPRPTSDIRDRQVLLRIARIVRPGPAADGRRPLGRGIRLGHSSQTRASPRQRGASHRRPGGPLARGSPVGSTAPEPNERADQLGLVDAGMSVGSGSGRPRPAYTAGGGRTVAKRSLDVGERHVVPRDRLREEAAE